MKVEERLEIYTKREEDLISKGYEKREKTISIIAANVLALVTAGPIAILCMIAFVIMYPNANWAFTLPTSFFLLLAMFACIFVHEGLHGIGWGIRCKDKRNISFGVMWKELTPYCSCSEPLNFGSYLLGSLMPLFVLGIGVFVIALLTGSTFLLELSVLNTIAAGGDTTISCMLCKYTKSVIMDHPSKCGFVAFTKN